MALAALLLAAALFPAVGCAADGRGADFNGTPLSDDSPAPAIELTNQFGEPFSLSDLRGQVVALTFLYTNCPDVCPITTSQLRKAGDELGADADSVAFVAVSVDPARDTAEAAQDYLERWELGGEWRFLVGERDALEPIWKSYYVDPYATTGGETAAPTRGAVDALSAVISAKYDVVHGAPVFLIDGDGWRRVVHTSPLDIGEMAQDIRALLRERRR